jgi:hypothetical protein
MKFKIKVDERQKEKTKEFLNEFVNKANDEFEKQMGKAKDDMKKIPTPIPVKYPEIMFDMDFFEEKDYFVLWNTIPMKGVMRLFGWSLRRNMEKNLRGFFIEKGIEAKIEFMGD